MTEHLHIVCTSRLATSHDHTVFGSICLSARARHIKSGIAGVLLFDGERFLQWLYGAQDAVSRLVNEISADERHTDLRVLLQGQLPTTEPDPRWRVGFVDASALDAFAALDPSDGGALLDGLASLIAGADLDPVVQAAPPPAASPPPRSDAA